MPEPREDPAMSGTSPVDCDRVEELGTADRYVLDRLSPEEAEAFEDHYMSCERCVAEVERAEMMARGFKHIAAEAVSVGGVAVLKPERSSASTGPAEPTDSTAAPPLPVDFANRRRRILGPDTRPAVLLAAAFAGAVLTLPLWIDRFEEPTSGDPHVSVAVFHLQPERSADGPGHRLDAEGTPAHRILALEIAPPFYSTYRAVVESEGQEAWIAEDLSLGERDTVHLRLPSVVSAPGRYTLRLEGALADGSWVDAGQFVFRIP